MEYTGSAGPVRIASSSSTQRLALRRPGECVLLARLIDEPQSTRAWRQGARGEIRTAGRLAKDLRDDGVLLLHDRRASRHGNANIDHIAVGPSGVLVIDSKTQGGKVRTDWVGVVRPSPNRRVHQRT